MFVPFDDLHPFPHSHHHGSEFNDCHQVVLDSDMTKGSVTKTVQTLNNRWQISHWKFIKPSFTTKQETQGWEEG